MTTEQYGHDSQANDALVQAAWKRNRLMLESFFEAKFTDLVRYVAMRASPQTDAENCVVAAFCRTLEDLDNADPDLDTDQKVLDRLYDHARDELRREARTWRTWFKALTLLKRERRAEDTENALGDLRDLYRLTAEQLSAQGRLILATFEQLTPEFHQALRLRFVLGHEPDEIAELLGIHRELVDQRIRRARVQFAKLLEEAYASAPSDTFPRFSIIRSWQAKGQRKAELRQQKMAARPAQQSPSSGDPV